MTEFYEINSQKHTIFQSGLICVYCLNRVNIV